MTPEEHVEGAAAYGDRTPPSSTDPSPQVPAHPSSGGSARAAADGSTRLSPKLSDGPSPEGLSVRGGSAAEDSAGAARSSGLKESVGPVAELCEAVADEWASGAPAAREQASHALAAEARDSAEPAAGERRPVKAVADAGDSSGSVAGEWELGGLTAEEQTDAFLDALALGYQPDATDPALRLLAALRHDLDDQRRSSVSMTPST